jgi:hypothetical protein
MVIVIEHGRGLMGGVWVIERSTVTMALRL